MNEHHEEKMSAEKMRAIGERIKERRIELRMTQIQLALKCGFKAQRRISAYETGEREPSITVIGKLAQALLTTIPYLLEGIAPLYTFPRPAKLGPVRYLPVLTPKEANYWSKFNMEKYQNDPNRKHVAIPADLGELCCVMNVNDDAMTSPHTEDNKTFLLKDYVIFDPQITPEPNRHFVVAQVKNAEGEDVLIIRKFVSDAGILKLIPLNPHYPILELDARITLKGVIVHKMVDFL